MREKKFKTEGRKCRGEFYFRCRVQRFKWRVEIVEKNEEIMRLEREKRRRVEGRFLHEASGP